MINLRDSQTNTLSPTLAWRELPDCERLNLIKKAQDAEKAIFEAVVINAAKPDGQVIVTLAEPMVASKRGQLLLDFEELLKNSVDPGLVVWLEPLGDRNSLRNLRGIEVKK